MIDRRRFVLGSSFGLFGVRFAAHAQSIPRLPRIGYLAFNTEVSGRHVLDAFRRTMRDLGWTEGRNVVIETRFADGEVERLPLLVSELLRLDVDMIVAGSSAVTRASKSATRTVPIVMLASADALGEGFVASLAQPGGNITGMTLLAGPEIASKQLEVLREIAPAATRVAALVNPLNGSHAAFAAELEGAARKLGTRLQHVRAKSPDQIDDAFIAMVKERAAALLVLSDAMFLGARRKITELARSRALPAMYSQREFVDAGGLASYGPSLIDMARGAAKHVDKILRGAKPRDLPVEQPTKFELLLNTRIAKALGITLPQSLILRADELIE